MGDLMQRKKTNEGSGEVLKAGAGFVGELAVSSISTSSESAAEISRTTVFHGLPSTSKDHAPDQSRDT